METTFSEDTWTSPVIATTCTCSHLRPSALPYTRYESISLGIHSLSRVVNIASLAGSRISQEMSLGACQVRDYLDQASWNGWKDLLYLWAAPSIDCGLGLNAKEKVSKSFSAQGWSPWHSKQAQAFLLWAAFVEWFVKVQRWVTKMEHSLVLRSEVIAVMNLTKWFWGLWNWVLGGI